MKLMTKRKSQKNSDNKDVKLPKVVESLIIHEKPKNAKSVEKILNEMRYGS